MIQQEPLVIARGSFFNGYQKIFLHWHMQFPQYIVFILISTIAGFLCMKRNTPLHLKIFPYFLLVTVLVEIVGWYLSTHNIHNNLMYNLYTIVEFVFYLYMMRQIVVNKTVRKIIAVLLAAFTAIAVTNFFFYQKPFVFNSVTFTTGCFLMVSLCIYYFFELFQLPQSVNLLREPSFYICSGFLFFFACSFTLMGLINYLANSSVLVLRGVSIMILSMNIMLYSLITIAFLCRVRFRKPAVVV